MFANRYIWDGDYIADTWLRDVAYIAVGLSILIATGTFFNLAGTISPMAVLKQARQKTDVATTKQQHRWHAKLACFVCDRYGTAKTLLLGRGG